MARICRFSFRDRSGAAGWSFDGSYLVVTPEEGGPLSFALPELAGIAGDGYTLRLTVPGAAARGEGAGGAAAGGAAAGGAALSGVELLLSHLGAEGPTLLDKLRREWIVARAEVLRLGGSGEGRPFSGQVTGLDDGLPAFGGTSGAAGAPEPFQGLLFEDVLVVAREGRDVEPLFLALFGAVESDEAAYVVRVRQWPGQEVVFSKLAGQTEEFVKRLGANRAALAEEAAATLAAGVPAVPAAPRGALSGMWMPGRLLEVEAMEAVCPGFAEAFRHTWLPSLLRHEEGKHLLEWADSGSSWLGCTREGGGAAGVGGDGGGPLWMLCGKEGVWFLEALSIEDGATYCFVGGEEMPALVARLLCAPQFSREALYSPLDELVGASADLAIPAQYLGFLVGLRVRFRDRVIHQTMEGWSRDVDALS